MDSLTHIAVGSCIGEAFLGKNIGKKAMLWGALAQSVPDVDFIASFWLDNTSNLLAHRGFTHSILFAILVAFFLALVAEKWHRPHNVLFRKWMLFFGVQIFIHLLLDGFNNYGVGWFEPFSHQRISFNAVYVADPFFSVWPGIAFIALLILRRLHPKRKFWWRFGVITAAFYLGYCISNKLKIDSDAQEITRLQGIRAETYLTTPAPLNNWLWYVLAGNDSGYYVGYRSVFDRKKDIVFTYFPRNDSLLHRIREQEDVQDLIRFSQGFYTVEKWGDTLVFNDLRFGQIIGWHDPKERFVFHYFLELPDRNTLVVQRGRFAKWNWETTRSLFKRMKGN
jgi:inner membrane protein